MIVNKKKSYLNIDKLLEQFPKVRIKLPSKYSEIYSHHYKSNRDGKTFASNLSSRMESWMHKHVAKGLRHSDITLEIGAGTLNQLKYEPNVGQYDIVEPFEFLFEGSSFLDRINNIYKDIKFISNDNKYDRITSIATFEHICDLPFVIAKCGILLNSGGVLKIGVPSEGTFLWKLGWKLTTGLEFYLRTGLDYEVIMTHEHVNTAKEILTLLNYFFHQVKGHSFGLCNQVSFYQAYTCCDPDLNRCNDYMNNYMAA